MKEKPIPLLGGLTASQFLSEYWQKKPLLVRQASPGFNGLLSPEAIFEAAGQDDVESRFVSLKDGTWDLQHGPFPSKYFRNRKTHWTVLLQGLNLFLPAGDALIGQFDFIPYARLDDLMVSYATEGSGVGPHFDSYDVFLLQGHGKRRWQIGAQKDQTLIPGLPVRILQRFQPTQDWTLEPGDMLYLPPQWAHDGVAVEGECTTYSIGFRAPPVQELAEGFLTHLQDTLTLEGRYADPDLRAQRHPAEIGTAMIDQVEDLLASIRWNRNTVKDFLGTYLTEPKPQVFFDPPEAPVRQNRFNAIADKKGIRLDARSKMLFSGATFFLNGEPVTKLPSADRARLQELADRRRIDSATGLSESVRTLLYSWYCDGYLHLQ